MRLLSLLCTLCVLATCETLHAGSATWKLDPATGDWNTAANWTPETVPNDPADIATFAISNTTAVSLSAPTHVDSLVFDPNASAFTVSTAAFHLTFLGAGIVNNSANEQNFVTGLLDGGSINFRNTASAGDAVFTIYGDVFQAYVSFYENTTAGNATFSNNGGFGGAVTWFFDSSTAGNATFYNFTGGDGFNDGVTVFEDEATAGTAKIFCEGGGVVFHKRSSAANSTIVSDSGNIVFTDRATAGNATITVNGAASSDADFGVLFFLEDEASADNATLIANGGTAGGHGGLIEFWSETRGRKARVELFGNGKLDIGSHNPLAPMTIGSLEGEGAVALGGNDLTIGANNLQTTFSGLITDGRNNTGGSITKVGNGTLDLTGSNNYTGGTTVISGNLLVDNITGSGTGTRPVQVIGGRLGGKGIIAGSVSVGTGQVGSGILAPGINATEVLTIQNTLTFAARGIYQWNLDTNGVRSDTIAATEVTINSGALFSAILLGDVTLPVGSVFTVIDNAGALPISGTFSNLPDGSSFAEGNNTFQVSYTGGDGNDLTVTVVQ
jgi:autotransporter-associated beta strand protein